MRYIFIIFVDLNVHFILVMEGVAPAHLLLLHFLYYLQSYEEIYLPYEFMKILMCIYESLL